MPSFCAVIGCGSRGGRDEVSFHRFPTILQYKNSVNLSNLAIKRRQQWIKALKRKDLTDTKLKYLSVCGKHFITGKPSKIEDVNNPDWVPCVNLGYKGSPFNKKPKDAVRHARLANRAAKKIAPSISVAQEGTGGSTSVVSQSSNPKPSTSQAKLKVATTSSKADHFLESDTVTDDGSTNSAYFCEVQYDSDLFGQSEESSTQDSETLLHQGIPVKIIDPGKQCPGTLTIEMLKQSLKANTVEQASTSKQVNNLAASTSNPGAIVVNVTKGINGIVESIMLSSCNATSRDREISLELATRLKETKEKQNIFSRFHSLIDTDGYIKGPTTAELIGNFNELRDVNEEILNISTELSKLNMNLLGRLQKQQANIRKGVTTTFNREIQKYQESVLLIMLKKKEEQNNLLKNEINSFKILLKNVKDKLQKSEKQCNEYKKCLDKCFTNNQIKYLTDNSEINWTNHELNRARILYSQSEIAYLYLRNELNYPLPDSSVLKQTFDSEEGIPTEIVIKEEDFDYEEMELEQISLVENVRLGNSINNYETEEQDIIDDIKIEYEDSDDDEGNKIKYKKLQKSIKKVYHKGS